MGVINDDLEAPCSTPPAKLFKAFILDGPNLMPKILPQIFKGFQTIEGHDGAAGSVQLISFTEESKIDTAKHRIDGIDEANYEYKYSLIEGGALGDDFESASYVIKIEAGPSGGSVLKVNSKYHTKGNDHHAIQEKIKQGKEGTKAFLNAVEAHLHAHPEEYN